MFCLAIKHPAWYNKLSFYDLEGIAMSEYAPETLRKLWDVEEDFYGSLLTEAKKKKRAKYPK